MERYLKPIGGEYWFDIELFEAHNNNFKDLNAIFLSGGQSSIEFIISELELDNKDEVILIPAYLCPTILYSFCRHKIKYVFYEINDDLSINVHDLDKKVRQYNVKAVFFINYFGFYHNKNTIKYLLNLKNKGIFIIEDAVQMLWFSKRKKFVGDYIFNSYRKFLPMDGSVVLCNKKKEFKSVQDNYYKFMNYARVIKSTYINFNICEERLYLRLFEKAEKEYYKRNKVYGMNKESKRLLDKVDYNLIKSKRLDNFNFIYKKVINNRKIKILFDEKDIEDNVPLGFPILVNNRDEIRKKLREFNIFCPTHWDVRGEEWVKNFPKSIYLADKIMTLPIDHRYDNKDIETLLMKLGESIDNENF